MPTDPREALIAKLRELREAAFEYYVVSQQVVKGPEITHRYLAADADALRLLASLPEKDEQ